MICRIYTVSGGAVLVLNWHGVDIGNLVMLLMLLLIFTCMSCFVTEVAEVAFQVVELTQVVFQLEVVDHLVQFLQIVTHQFEVEVLIREAVVPLRATEKGNLTLETCYNTTTAKPDRLGSIAVSFKPSG